MGAKRARIAGLKASLREMIREYDRNTCVHEETYRGGAIWTICSSCGRKWADDKGGFAPYEEPEFVERARRLAEDNPVDTKRKD